MKGSYIALSNSPGLQRQRDSGLHPAMSAVDPSIQQILSAAADARRRGAWGEEGGLLEDALKRAPENPIVQNALGMKALADLQPASAARWFAAAIEQNASEPALWMNLATARRAQGDVEGERGSLKGALAIDQLNFMGQLRLAELEQRVGNHATAVQCWAAVLQMSVGLEQIPPALQGVLNDARTYMGERAAALEAAVSERIRPLLNGETSTSSRFQACMDHIAGRRKIYQNQCAGIHFPFLPAVEFFDRSLFPWLSELESAADQITQEAVALFQNGSQQIRPYVRQDSGSPTNKWSELDGSLDWSACFLWEYGRPNEAVCELCPATTKALSRVPQNIIPGKAPSAFFSVLRPGAHIPPHTGVTNTRAIVHLPLVVPPGCSFRVGGEARVWREGEAFAFDDTIEHEAWNNSDRVRIILILDVWNPYLSDVEQELLQALFDASA